jgi:hypothetical protein
MATTKTKSSSSKRNPGSRSGSSKGSPRSSKGSASSKGASSKRVQSARRSNGSSPNVRSGSSSKSSNSKASSSGSRKVQGTGGAIGKAASKAKMPLLAGGAAIAGAAGGLALGARQAHRHSRLGQIVPRKPQVKVNSKDLANAAKEVGNFGAQMGRLASELKETREATNGKHRSPVEVVLDGLTSRRH